VRKDGLTQQLKIAYRDTPTSNLNLINSGHEKLPALGLLGTSLKTKQDWKN